MTPQYQRFVHAALLLRALLIGAAWASGAGNVTAQEYPTKPIRIIVANATGDPADLGARLLAPEMSRYLGQPVIVENRPGAGTLVGSDYVARQAPADGYTIAVISVNALLILPLTIKEVNFDPVRDLPAFINIASTKLVIASPASAPWMTFNEMAAYAKANPHKLNYGSSSSTTRLLTELILKERSLDIVYVPYSSTAANITAMMGGENQLGFMTESLAANSGGKLRVLAQTGDKGSGNYPDVPTFAQLGFPQIPATAYSFNARAGTPRIVIDKLYAATVQALKQPEIRAGLAKLSLDITEPTAPDAAARSQATLSKIYADLAKQVGIKPE